MRSASFGSLTFARERPAERGEAFVDGKSLC